MLNATDVGSEPSDEILRANAFRLIVREMGNGVDRVDGLELVPIALAREDARLPDACALGFPAPERFVDLVECAGAPMGFVSGGLARLLPAGYSRPLDDGRIEMTMWMAMLV